MNLKKTFVAIPLSVSLLVPSLADVVSAEDHTKPKVDTAAVELRADLDRMFSEHVYLAMTAMRKGANQDPDFEQAVAALEGNTQDLTAAITSVYGEEAGNQFNEFWSNHIGFFVDYVKATANEDEAAKQEALDNLENYKEEFSTFMSEATDNQLKSDALAEGLQTHINQLIGGFNAFVEGDYEEAYETQSNAMEHMYMTSKGLSSAIVNQFPDKFNNTKAVTKAAQLRSDLDFLLSEHFALAQQAMQNGIQGAPEFEANVATLQQNTEELSATIGSVYGEEAGQKFKDLWSSHIGYFVDYVKATGKDDEEARQEALAELDDYRKDFSQFMSTATEERVPSDGLAQGLQVHVDQLTGTFDQYVNENYGQSWDIARSGYDHMFTPAKLFSGAIAAQFPEKFSKSEEKDMKFTDVSAEFWASEYIYGLANAGIVYGMNEDQFMPKEEVTRGQFTAMLARTLNLEASIDLPFIDVSETFSAEIAAAYEAGITNGMTEETFAPNEKITRQQMAAMAVRAYNAKMNTEYEPKEDYMYEDEAHISPRFNAHVDAARELELMVGNGGDQFNPMANANRAQAAKVMFLLHQMNQ
ncbi:S-layer homology domain-containing protein [Pontibacillus sp. HMF3514]|uniref:S-layer homology domain-containing protein n=1 Tax=Pontibacillus sp. HMF3514 TaxID=2692425 RepID=UPI0013201E53|nr:S-layer homology domain-containing protein [Pontibacillus sp. HMF3514]QHE50759.1 copper amine oxidase [Pontibacillus sp. HMF3514]